MKVISGKLKGRLLKSPDGIRPVTSMIKEAIFNTLNWIEWEKANVLDLFCGSGNFGIEAISRGAKYVIFVDKSKMSIEFVEKNLQGIEWNGRLIISDFKPAIKNLFKKGEKFNIIFADPPFDLFLGDKILSCLEKYDLLENEGVIVLRVRDKEKIVSLEKWVHDVRKYGDSLVYYLKKG